MSVNIFTVAPLQSSLAVGGVNDGEAVHSIVASTPAFPMTGACVSRAVIVCVLLAEWLPQASVASHVLVSVFTQPLTLLVSVSIFTVAPLQSSLAVGAVNDGEAGHSIVASTPAFPMTGACVSRAVIVCVLVAEWLPQASVASQVLVYVFTQPLTLLMSVNI